MRLYTVSHDTSIPFPTSITRTALYLLLPTLYLSEGKEKGRNASLHPPLFSLRPCLLGRVTGVDGGLAIIHQLLQDIIGLVAISPLNRVDGG